MYFWDGAGTRFDLYSNVNVISADTWYSIEVQDNETTTGHGEVWLNGISIGSFDGDLFVTQGYATLIFYSEAAGATYFDDVKISSTFQ